MQTAISILSDFEGFVLFKKLTKGVQNHLFLSLFSGTHIGQSWCHHMPYAVAVAATNEAETSRRRHHH